ncbi:MAG: hypothetical protein IJS01_01045 [Lentisphaeria bacterium]|nr:hypothetical protein [Lentisphaeria bacterium]
MYIDAGTGSMLIQAAAAGVFTCLIFFRQITAWCRTQFRRKERENGTDIG